MPLDERDRELIERLANRWVLVRIFDRIGCLGTILLIGLFAFVAYGVLCLSLLAYIKTLN